MPAAEPLTEVELNNLRATLSRVVQPERLLLRLVATIDAAAQRPAASAASSSSVAALTQRAEADAAEAAGASNALVTTLLFALVAAYELLEHREGFCSTENCVKCQVEAALNVAALSSDATTDASASNASGDEASH